MYNYICLTTPYFSKLFKKNTSMPFLITKTKKNCLIMPRKMIVNLTVIRHFSGATSPLLKEWFKNEYF